jgi:hypothetical protein
MPLARSTRLPDVIAGKSAERAIPGFGFNQKSKDLVIDKQPEGNFIHQNDTIET